MNAAHAVSIDPNGVNPTAITGSNPQLLPTMADPVNLSAANHHSVDNRAPTWDSTPFQRNGAETWVSLNLALQLSARLQMRLGVENLTNQRVIHTDPLNPHHQSDYQYGWRFNVGGLVQALRLPTS